LGAEEEVAKMYRTIMLVCVVAAAAAGYGSEFEVKWDTGTFGFQIAYSKGLDTWYANDFDVSERWSGPD